MRYLLALFMIAVLSAPAYAAFKGPGTQTPGTTVAQAKSMRDDSRVALVGNIVAQVSGTDDKYIFRDATGEILVDIDYKDFGGQDVTPANTVRIYGEVEKEFGRAPEIDVKRLEVLN